MQKGAYFDILDELTLGYDDTGTFMSADERHLGGLD